jgi:hypothetical protein
VVLAVVLVVLVLVAAVLVAAVLVAVWWWCWWWWWCEPCPTTAAAGAVSLLPCVHAASSSSPTIRPSPASTPAPLLHLLSSFPRLRPPRGRFVQAKKSKKLRGGVRTAGQEAAKKKALSLGDLQAQRDALVAEEAALKQELGQLKLDGLELTQEEQQAAVAATAGASVNAWAR